MYTYSTIDCVRGTLVRLILRDVDTRWNYVVFNFVYETQKIPERIAARVQSEINQPALSNNPMFSIWNVCKLDERMKHNNNITLASGNTFGSHIHIRLVKNVRCGRLQPIIHTWCCYVKMEKREQIIIMQLCCAIITATMEYKMIILNEIPKKVTSLLWKQDRMYRKFWIMVNEHISYSITNIIVLDIGTCMTTHKLWFKLYFLRLRQRIDLIYMIYVYI